jgi:predicted enzyme related to lactoylglutathione lyase
VINVDGVVGFSIPVDEMKRAVRFYRSLFGWEIERIEGSGGEFHGAQTTECDERGEPSRPGAINGGMFLRGTHGIEETFLEVKVDSIDRCIERVEALGGTVIRPKAPMLDFAYFAIIKDSEGNAIGLWEVKH